jgi:hypothetical protein
MADEDRNYLELCGFEYKPEEIEKIMALQPMPVMMATDIGIKDSGKGKEVFLFEVERRLTGKVRPPHNQTIGDCVSHGVTGAAEDLQFVQMSKDESLEFKWLASEVTYGLARIEIGRGGCGRGDGAVVGWGLEAGKRYGFVTREPHGKWDLTTYDGQRARQWGAPGVGCPDDLEPIAKKNPIVEMSTIEGPDYYTQAIDVIANGGVIVTGSNQLYQNSRDERGFCRRGGNGGHCTHYNGFADTGSFPGIVYSQSWGERVPSQGEQRVTLGSGAELLLPPGHFFITPEDFNRMHARGAEVWAITALQGWARPDLDLDYRFY